MKSNTLRNKVFTIYKNNQENIYKADLQLDIKNYLVKNIEKINVFNNMISVPYSVDNDFLLLTPWVVDDGESEESYNTWTIEFPFMPEGWISGIKPVILKKYGEDSTGELQDTTDVKENFIISIEDLESSSVIKKVTVNVSYVARDYYTVQDDIQVKLLLYIPTPIITI
ncbi:MAG: hypothetical protein M0R03_16945 [Novosphingobium sp.]|nr:hypothetical protein [Novosphingobium sp.]